MSSVAFSPDGTQALSGSDDDTLKLWDLASGKCLRPLEGHSSFVTSVAFSPDGTQALSGSWETLKLWDLASGKCLRTFEGHSKWVSSVAFSPDGTQALSGSGDNTLKLWDITSGKCIQTLEGHAGGVTSVAFSPDGTKALSGSHDKTFVLWDLVSGCGLFTFLSHSEKVLSVIFSSDGAHALTGGADKTLRMWDLASGKHLQTFNGHTRSVTGLSFSADGVRALSSSADGTIRLWNTGTGHEIATLFGYNDGEWMVKTPRGYYTTSEGAGNLFAWTVGTKTYPIDAFPNPYHRPDLVEQTLQRGSLCPVPDRPPVLRLALEFQEEWEDGVLDAEETATVVVTIANMGAGAACLERLDLGIEDLKGVQIEGGGDLLDNLEPGEEVTYSLSLTSDRSIRDGTGRVVITISEINGFDSTPAGIEFETRAFQKPRIEIAGYDIIDSEQVLEEKLGRGKIDSRDTVFGNGNGRIDKGETVAVVVRVCNRGGGATRGGAATFSEDDPNLYGLKQDPFTLGEMLPDTCRDLPVFFMVNTRFEGKKLPIRMDYMDERPDLSGGADLDLAIAEAPRDIILTRITPKPAEPNRPPSEESVDDVPRLPTPTGRDNLAVVIGIEDYRDLKHGARYAKRDADIFKDYLIHAMGFPPEGVKLLLNEKATMADINWHLNDWLPKNVTEDSRVVFYFAGHGAPHPAPKNPSVYLVPWDVSSRSIVSSGFKLSALYQTLGALPAKEVLVVLDACFTGEGERSVAEGGRPMVNKRVRKPRPRSGKLVVLSAARADQMADWDETHRHGIFTYYLLKGLGGDAETDDSTSRGWITLNEVFRYLSPEVDRCSLRKTSRKQEPDIDPKLDELGELGTLKLTRLPNVPASDEAGTFGP